MYIQCNLLFDRKKKSAIQMCKCTVTDIKCQTGNEKKKWTELYWILTIFIEVKNWEGKFSPKNTISTNRPKKTLIKTLGTNKSSLLTDCAWFQKTKTDHTAHVALTGFYQASTGIALRDFFRENFICETQIYLSETQYSEANYFSTSHLKLKISEFYTILFIQSMVYSLRQRKLTQWDAWNVPWASIRSSPSSPATLSRVSIF